MGTPALDSDNWPWHVSHLCCVPLTDTVNEGSQTPVESATFHSACDNQSADDDNSSDEEHEETLTLASSQPDATVNSVAPEHMDNETGPDPTTHDQHPLSCLADCYQLQCYESTYCCMYFVELVLYD